MYMVRRMVISAAPCTSIWFDMTNVFAVLITWRRRSAGAVRRKCGGRCKRRTRRGRGQDGTRAGMAGEPGSERPPSWISCSGRPTRSSPEAAPRTARWALSPQPRSSRLGRTPSPPAPRSSPGPGAWATVRCMGARLGGVGPDPRWPRWGSARARRLMCVCECVVGPYRLLHLHVAGVAGHANRQQVLVAEARDHSLRRDALLRRGDGLAQVAVAE